MDILFIKRAGISCASKVERVVMCAEFDILQPLTHNRLKLVELISVSKSVLCLFNNLIHQAHEILTWMRHVYAQKQDAVLAL